jgi:hypothetical protein
MRHAAREAAEVATYEKDLAEIKPDVRLLKCVTGTTLAGVLVLVIRPHQLNPLHLRLGADLRAGNDSLTFVH